MLNSGSATQKAAAPLALLAVAGLNGPLANPVWLKRGCRDGDHGSILLGPSGWRPSESCETLAWEDVVGDRRGEGGSQLAFFVGQSQITCAGQGKAGLEDEMEVSSGPSVTKVRFGGGSLRGPVLNPS